MFPRHRRGAAGPNGGLGHFSPVPSLGAGGAPWGGIFHQSVVRKKKSFGGYRAQPFSGGGEKPPPLGRGDDFAVRFIGEKKKPGDRGGGGGGNRPGAQGGVVRWGGEPGAKKFRLMGKILAFPHGWAGGARKGGGLFGAVWGIWGRFGGGSGGLLGGQRRLRGEGIRAGGGNLPAPHPLPTGLGGTAKGNPPGGPRGGGQTKAGGLWGRGGKKKKKLPGRVFGGANFRGGPAGGGDIQFLVFGAPLGGRGRDFLGFGLTFRERVSLGQKIRPTLGPDVFKVDGLKGGGGGAPKKGFANSWKKNPGQTFFGPTLEANPWPHFFFSCEKNKPGSGGDGAFSHGFGRWDGLCFRKKQLPWGHLIFLGGRRGSKIGGKQGPPRAGGGMGGRIGGWFLGF